MKLTKSQQTKIKQIGKKHHLKLMVIYGSYAKNQVKPGSDLDIAILGQKKVSFEELLEIQGELGQVFGDSPDRELDVVSLHTDDILFRYLIMKDSQLIYGRLLDYYELKSFTFREYLDARPLFHLEELLNQKTLKRLAQRYA